MYLYTEGGDAPGWPGAKSEHVGNIRAMCNAARRDAAPAECQMYRYIELRTLDHSTMA